MDIRIRFVFDWRERNGVRVPDFSHWVLTLDNERKTIGRNSRAKTRPLQYSVLVLIAKVQRAAGIFYPWKEGWLEMLRAGCAADYPAQVFGGGWPAALVNSLKRDQAAFDKLKPAAWGPHLIGKDPETESPNRPSKGNLMGTLWDYIDFELLPEFPSHDDGADRSIIVEDCFKLLWQFINCCESWETITAPAYLGELHALQRSELKKEREEADRALKFLRLYHLWKESKRTQARTPDPVPGTFKQAFLPKNRNFVKWCWSVCHDPESAEAGLNRVRVQEMLKAMAQPEVGNDYSLKQHALLKWLAHVSSICPLEGEKAEEVRRHIGDEIEAKDAHREIVSKDVEFKRHPGEPFVRGAVLDPQDPEDTVITRALLGRMGGDEQAGSVAGAAVPISVRVDKFVSKASGHIYAHPAYALAVTRDMPPNLNSGMTFVSTQIRQNRPFHENSFRWALVEDGTFGGEDNVAFDEIADGHQIAAAALVAACVLRLKPEVRKWLKDWNIWVQFGIESKLVECRTDSKLLEDLTGKGKHLVLLVRSSQSKMLTNALRNERRGFVPLEKDDGVFESIAYAITNAMETYKVAKERPPEAPPSDHSEGMQAFDSKGVAQKPAAVGAQPSKASEGGYFVGRVESLRKLKQVLKESRNRTVCICAAVKGMGGVGKTELAHYFADQFIEKSNSYTKVSVDLWGHRRPQDAPLGEKPKSPIVALEELCRDGFKIAELVARLRDKHTSDSAYLEALRGVYEKYLYQNRVIVILDNAFDAAQVAPLLPSGKTYSLFIITSRELIEIDGLLSAVNRVDLPPMDASEVELWMRESDLARGLEGHVEEMMQATGGLPLAISILLSRWHWTGRLKLGGPSAFFNSLKLIKLSAHDRHDTRNQRLTLHRCFTFSTRDLHAREREGLLRLSVFPGRFDAAAVAAVCCPATGSSNEALSQARHLILRLVSISLMEVDQSNQDRYWLHDLVREFCDQELSENPSARADALRAFSEHYAAVACHCGEQFRRGGDHSRAAAKHFILEQQNIGHGYRIAKNLARTLTRRDEVRHAAAAVIVYAGCAIRVADLVQTASDRERWTQSAIDLAQQHFKTLPGLRGRLIVANGLAKRHLNDPKEAMKCMDAAQKVFEKLSQPDWAGISDACGNRGNLHTDLAGLIRDCADKRAEGKMAKKGLINLSEAELIEYRNHYQKAELEHNKARAISEKLPSDRGLGQDLGNLAIVYAEYGRIEKGWGDPEVAKAWFKKALQFYRKRNDQAAHRQVRDDRGRGNGLGNLGNLHCTLGEFAPALKCQEEALKLHKDTGNQRGEAATLGNQASIHFHRGAPGDLEQCIRLNHLSAELFQKLGDEAGGERSLANAKIAETRLAAVREGQAGAKTQTVSEPALHLADRYGKVTDIHLDDILGVRLEGIRRSLELARACENRLRRRR